MVSALEWINKIVWEYILVYALLGTGIFLSIRLRFPQIRRFGRAFSTLSGGVRGHDRASGISPFQALSTAVAAQVGTGNIVGVASAIAAGGPGAAFWMMLSAFFGMSTIFSEAVLAQLYREEIGGIHVGGPAYYIRKGLKSKFFSYFFAAACVAASMAIGIMVQSNAIVVSVHQSMHIDARWVNLALAAVVFIILSGGLKRIANFAQIAVPVMATLYISATLFILATHGRMIPVALRLIVRGAFTPEAIGGGVLGITVQKTMRYGLARGLFSNEAGMGSTPHSHAAAACRHPVDQGLVAMTGVFISTFCICMSTVLMNIVSGSYDPSIPAAQMAQRDVLMTQQAFVIGFGAMGEVFLSVCLSLFALTTILGWYYFAESNIRFLFHPHPSGIRAFKILVTALLLVGGWMTSDIVWKIADFLMALMVLPNITALVALSGKVRSALADWEVRYAQKE